MPKQILRLYLSTAADTHRKFYWFEINNNDLYWGTSSDVKEAFCTITNKNNESFSIQTPSNFKELLESKSKYSYHESGSFHRRQLEGSQYSIMDFMKKWPKKSILTEPFKFFSLISKPFYEYPIETKKLNRDKGFGQGILLENETSRNRLYMEFFISEYGEQTMPKSVLNFGDHCENIIYQKMNDKFIIITRFTKLDNLFDWHPDKEIILLE